MFKTNNKDAMNTRLGYETCLKLTIKIPEQRLDTCITVLLFLIVCLFGWLEDVTKK